MLTSDDLRAMRERCGAADVGPWYTRLASEMFEPSLDVGMFNKVILHMDPRPWRPDDGPKEFAIAGDRHPVDHENAIFIASARTDLPACLDEIERLRMALTRITQSESSTDWFYLAEDALAGKPVWPLPK